MEKELAKTAEQILAILGISGTSLEIFLVTNKIMRDINREYRGRDRETNILSFEATDIPRPEEKLRHLGEIYLAPQYISAHNENINHLLVHGVLHLLGYDHEQGERKARIMEKKEEEIIKKLGYGA